MKITFVLPGAGNVPVGGFKVVYEYANGLERRGHAVTVVHSALLDSRARVRERSRAWGRYLFRRLRARYGPSLWFPLNSRVQSTWVPSLEARYVPDADVVVATAWQTAEWVSKYPRSRGERFYLIQHLETWSGVGERVLATWRLPLRKIVISRWLLDVAKAMGEEADYIPNGLDFDAFGLDLPPEARDSSQTLMMYHEAEWKGAADGLKALVSVKQRNPELNAALFGVPEAPAQLPGWIRYYRQPPQQLLRSLYNQAAVFVSPSRTEGWGLTASEAMMSGCALAATDAGGHREFAIHEETALVSSPGDPAALAANIERLLRKPELRLRLATAGHQYIQRFTWERALSAFEQAIQRQPPTISPADLGTALPTYGA